MRPLGLLLAALLAVPADAGPLLRGPAPLRAPALPAALPALPVLQVPALSAPQAPGGLPALPSLPALQAPSESAAAPSGPAASSDLRTPPEAQAAREGRRFDLGAAPQRGADVQAADVPALPSLAGSSPRSRGALVGLAARPEKPLERKSLKPWAAFGVSAAIHGILLSVANLLQPAPPPRPAQSTPIKIELIQSPPSRRQVVQSRAGEETKTPAPDAYLGEKTRKVREQTRAKTPSLGALGQGAPQGRPALKDLSPKPEADGPGPKKAEENAESRGERGQGAGPSDAVDGVKEGETNALNTREFVYFSFYQRIRQRLEQAWPTQLRGHLRRHLARGGSLASGTDHRTRLLVVLDAQGAIQNVRVVGASGTEDLDEAAVEAFREAGPFPNPPKGLIEPGGTVQVRWDFILRN